VVIVPADSPSHFCLSQTGRCLHGVKVRADTENLQSSQTLLTSARDSFEATQRRYTGGAGSILELLCAQAAYASAAQQRIQAQSDWRVARLALMGSLGRLGPSAAD
jgi:outer membrane protein